MDLIVNYWSKFMITLIFYNLNLLTATTPELVGGWITLIVDIICAIILLVKAFKTKKVSIKDFLLLFGTNAGRKKLSNEIGKIISALEKEEQKEQKEQKEQDENEVK